MTQKLMAFLSDSWIFSDDASSGRYGNGKGPRLSIGHSAITDLTGKNRAVIGLRAGDFFDGFDGVPGPQTAANITAFDFVFYVKSGCAGIGGSPSFFLEKATAAWGGENSYALDCGLNQNGLANNQCWPSPATTTTNRASWSGTATADTPITVHALALGRAWFDEFIANLRSPSLGLTVVGKAADETANAQRISFYSNNATTKRPYVQMTWDSNQPPFAPTDMASTPGADGRSMTVTARHTDPEADPATRFQVQWVPDPD